MKQAPQRTVGAAAGRLTLTAEQREEMLSACQLVTMSSTDPGTRELGLIFVDSTYYLQLHLPSSLLPSETRLRNQDADYSLALALPLLA